ncbi:MAG TPA: ribonuclease H-like domain-containing protein [Candidatus Paceibacterota bacterium]
MDDPKLLVVDIETAPAELYGWGMYNQNFGVEQVKEHPFILMIGYKWVGSKESHCLVPLRLGDNEDMLREITEKIIEADAIVTKNGIRFDIPWINAELARFDLPPLPQVTHIDLEKVARAKFRFFCNKLDYIGQYLGLGKKVEHEGFALWRKVLAGDKKAKDRMVTYCIGDLTLTEKIYKRMLPHIHDHPILRAIGAEVCPTCHSKHTQRRGKRYTRYFEIQRHQCMNRKCGAWFSGHRKKVA